MNIKLTWEELNSCLAWKLSRLHDTLELRFQAFGLRPITNVFYAVTQNIRIYKKRSKFHRTFLTFTMCDAFIVYLIPRN